MISVATSPGLYFTRAPRPTEASPLRSDVGGFIGRTRRGPIGQPVRVEEWRGFIRVFGGLLKDADTPYAIRGYFENGGEVAYVVRLGEPFPTDEQFRSPDRDDAEPDLTNVATGLWTLGQLDPQSRQWQDDSPAGGGFEYAEYTIEATSPGEWANGTRISINYRFDGVSGKPELDMTIQPPDEPGEYLFGLKPGLRIGDESKPIEEQVAEQSNFIRLRPTGPKAVASASVGRRHIAFKEVVLTGGLDVAPSIERYHQAIQRIGDEPEVALTCVPDLYTDVDSDEDQKEILMRLIQQAEEARDRMVIVDFPPQLGAEVKASQVESLIGWAKELRNLDQSGAMRAAAIYHPPLRVPDPLGDITTPLRTVPPSGHVAGLISLLDRQRGAHHTPANAELIDAVDIEQEFMEPERALLNDAGINLLRCVPGRGLQVWGGRTLSANQPASDAQLSAASPAEKSARFVAHRRLIHRLIRAIRRVAEPLVFDLNGPELWLTFVRAVTTVLLEAFRAGALKGARAEEAFRVRCDAKTNPPTEVDQGRVLCEIELAPATPMEFILLRVALSSDGTLEVFES